MLILVIIKTSQFTLRLYVSKIWSQPQKKMKIIFESQNNELIQADWNWLNQIVNSIECVLQKSLQENYI